MRRSLVMSIASMLVLALVIPANAGHNTDVHSANMSKVSTFTHDGTYRAGTDLAFWGNLAVLGNFDWPGGFRLLDIADPAAPSLVGQFKCPGSQADVSIWKSLVFLSVDSPRSKPECGAGGASQDQILTNTHWEGLRVVSIADRTNPVQIAAVKTDCGSHTHTLVPDTANDRVLIYVLSYPVSGQGPGCNAESHRKFSIVEVPLRAPETARVIATPRVDPAVGCHDVTVLIPAKLAAAACISESQMWDISDPAAPKILSHIVNPAINIHHSSTFSSDGATIVLGDELGGALATPGCFDQGHAPLGALWFYDVSDPSAPKLKGFWKIPQQETSVFCTAHNFNVIPLTTDRDILVSGWYNGGSTVVDFTDPSAPKQLGYYIPKEGGTAAAWSTYWYNGLIYSNNFDEDVHSVSGKSRGFDVFRFDDPVVEDAIRLKRLNPQTQEDMPRARRAKG